MDAENTGVKPETIGDRLKAFAKECYKTVSALAIQMNMSPSSLACYVDNRSQPGARMQAKLREAGCNIEWLMTGKNPFILTDAETSGNVELAKELENTRQQLMDAQLLNVKLAGQLEIIRAVLESAIRSPARPAFQLNDGSVIGIGGEIIKPASNDKT